MNISRNPALILILNALIGGLVAHGVVDPAVQNDIVDAAAEIIGLLIILASSAVSLWHLIHQKKLEGEIQKQQTTQTVTQTTVAAQTVPVVSLDQPTPIPVKTEEVGAAGVIPEVIQP